MPRKKGTLKMGSNMEPNVNAPLDSRTKVMLKVDLTDPESFPYKYLGMQVFVEEEMKRYTLIADDTTNITSWKVDAEGSGAGGTIENAIDVTEDVGGIPSGTAYASGEDMEKILRDLLNPLKNPTLTPPSGTLAIISGPSLIEKGGTATLTFSATLNRGKIDPPYGTSGYGSGPGTSFELYNAADPTTPITVGAYGATPDHEASESVSSFYAHINYEEGEQPKNSHKEDYDHPLPAGFVKTNTINIEFVNALWSNVANIASVTKESLLSKSAKSKQFVFPPCTAENPEIFDVPSDWNVTKVEVLSELSGKFEDCSSEFSTSSVTHKNASDEDVNYTRYSDNRGYASGSRTIKVTWS